MIKYEACSLILQKEENKYGLFLGDAQAAKDKKQLQKNRIYSIISIGQQSIPKTKYENIRYYKLQLRDQKNEDVTKHFQSVNQRIEDERKKGNVFIHCYHGVSRSATFVIAYIMFIKDISFQDAFKFVKEKRKCISPNQGFRKQLSLFKPINTKLQIQTKDQTRQQ